MCSDENYALLWNLLNERYDNKKFIISEHVKAIFELPNVTKDSAIAIRDLTDNLNKNLRALKNLGQPVDSWDTLINHIIINKFDLNTNKAYSEYLKDRIPTITDLNLFLKERCELLEQFSTNKIMSSEKYKPRETITVKRTSYISTNQNSTNHKCPFCNENMHSPFNCNNFTNLTPHERYSKAKELKLCVNCLRSNHTLKNCNSTNTCKTCNKAHHTLMHFDEHTHNYNMSNTSDTTNSQIVAFNQSAHILLATAVAQAQDSNGKWHSCRLLLDGGSQSHFITESYAKLLNLKFKNTHIPITGIGHATSNINQQTNIIIKSNSSNYTTTLNCLIIAKLTEKVPQVILSKNINIPSNVTLADPNYNIPGTVDILLGAEIFWSLIGTQKINLGKNQPIMHNTPFGWILAGTMPIQTITTSITAFSLDQSLNRFWELEEPQFNHPPLSKDEKWCEQHYSDTIERNKNGHYVVSIPLKENYIHLGSSQEQALQRFYNLEKKLDKQPDIKNQYTAFIKEYQSLNHMTLLENYDHSNQSEFYLPHHPVIKNSLTTQLRVVFDGSAKSTSGLSLNDVQHIGPKLQNDMREILIRFRQHSVVLSGDIMKMYRMILVKPDQRPLQRIFWRDNQTDKIQCFQLNTVTYGTGSAPYLAIRTIKQIALEIKDEYPEISNIINDDFYVDDLLTGSDSIAEAKRILQDLIIILTSRNFTLRKLVSNKPAILENIPRDVKSHNVVNLGDNENTKTLGVVWNPTSDTIQYNIQTLDQQRTTKRTILSTICQIFDPLSLLGPIIINAKIIIQEMWMLKVDWDDEVPINLSTKWFNFINELQHLNKLKIPRQIKLNDHVRIELHGFCDASEKAYGGCIYLKSINSAGNTLVQLVCAKSKVATVHTTTLPRLELCGAVVLAQLSNQVIRSLKLNIDKNYYWCDSTIAINWLKSAPSRWKTFVANRVALIQELTNEDDWDHINSKDNPADLISRGVTPEDLINSKLWWNGPKWLNSSNINYPSKFNTTQQYANLPEYRQPKVSTYLSNFHTTHQSFVDTLFNKYSTFNKLQRVLSYIFRFALNLKKPSFKRNLGSLTTTELNHSLEILIKLVQTQSFQSEIKSLQQEKPIDSKSNLLRLTPFLDNKQILRVGGRLKLSKFNYDKKHPILLPAKHPFTTLLLKQEHIRLLHCGAQTLLYSLRDKYWPLNGRIASKQTIRNCCKCNRFNVTPIQYLMGDLPSVRVQITTPFFNTGVDYAGPFLVKDRKTRNPKFIKCYVCFFICLATKAVHIELVSELTTDAFLLTLRRFIARRGLPANIYSDNGSNFVGANNHLRELTKIINIKSTTILDELNKNNIKWHFIPPYSPNFGGIWEAGVKGAKFHLKRIVGNAHLNFEELSTVLTQIEAVMNSRPIHPMSSDPNDLCSLTPAHFLIGKPLISLPDHDHTETPINRLTRYQLQQKLVQHFWKRYNQGYISELQIKAKWSKNHPNLLKEGTLVLINDHNLPPLSWKLGRVIQLHPGTDGIIRVVTIKVQNATIKRSVTKLFVLPSAEV